MHLKLTPVPVGHVVVHFAANGAMPCPAAGQSAVCLCACVDSCWTPSGTGCLCHAIHCRYASFRFLARSGGLADTKPARCKKRAAIPSKAVMDLLSQIFWYFEDFASGEHGGPLALACFECSACYMLPARSRSQPLHNRWAISGRLSNPISGLRDKAGSCCVTVCSATL